MQREEKHESGHTILSCHDSLFLVAGLPGWEMPGPGAPLLSVRPPAPEFADDNNQSLKTGG